MVSLNSGLEIERLTPDPEIAGLNPTMDEIFPQSPNPQLMRVLVSTQEAV